MSLRRPSMTRRRLALPAMALVAALGLGGCSVVQRASAAAIVNGRSISSSEVAATTTQWNATLASSDQEGPLSEPRVVGYLLLSSFVIDQVKKSGSWAPDAQYTSLLAKVKGPVEGTVDVLKTKSALGKLTQADVEAIVARLKASDIQLNPRYGTFDPESGGAKDPSKDIPNWIKPAPAPADPGATAPAPGQ